MKLAKSCEEKFNIKHCNTLQLGTFSHYAEMDPSFSIADAKEGSLIIKNFSTADSAHGDTVINTVSSEFNSELTLTVRAGATPDTILVEPNIKYRNSFIFCLSILNENEQYNPSIVNNENDSYYIIENNNINGFANYVLYLLKDQLTYDDIDFGAIGNPPIKDFISGQISVQIMHAEVMYPKTKDAAAESLNGYTPADLFNYAAFNKDEKYKTDREYRFLYLITHPIYGIIPVKKSPKILLLKKIMDLIS